MAQPTFPARVAYGYEHTVVEEYTPSATAGETMAVGELCTLAAGVVKRCGADPASIIGISEVDSEKAKGLTQNGKVPIRVLTENATVIMGSDTVPVEATHLNVAYGIVRDGTTGFWKVDTSDTTNTRVTVVRLNVAEGLWYVKFLAANLADSGIVS